MSSHDKAVEFDKNNPMPECCGNYTYDEWFLREDRKLEYIKNNNQKRTIFSRRCVEEEKTNQFLGYKNNAVKNNTWENTMDKKCIFTVVKHFRC